MSYIEFVCKVHFLLVENMSKPQTLWTPGKQHGLVRPRLATPPFGQNSKKLGYLIYQLVTQQN